MGALVMGGDALVMNGDALIMGPRDGSSIPIDSPYSMINSMVGSIIGSISN